MNFCFRNFNFEKWLDKFSYLVDHIKDGEDENTHFIEGKFPDTSRYLEEYKENFYNQNYEIYDEFGPASLCSQYLEYLCLFCRFMHLMSQNAKCRLHFPQNDTSLQKVYDEIFRINTDPIDTPIYIIYRLKLLLEELEIIYE